MHRCICLSGLPTVQTPLRSEPTPGDIWITCTVRASEKRETSAALLGLAFDNHDGHTRLSRGKNFVLVGGSQETHTVMQETALKINEHLDRQGKRLEDVSAGELRDICQRVHDSLSDG